MTGAVFLHAPRYVLGEHELPYTDVVDLAARAERFGLAFDPRLWGWGNLYRTERGLPDLAADSARATLAGSGYPPSTVDALVLCSTRVPEASADHGRFVGAVLDGAGLGDRPYYGVNFNRCLGLLAGIDLAAALVKSGRYRRVLVASADRVADEADRLAHYALFSDAAASCLLTTDPVGPDGYEVLGCAAAVDNRSAGYRGEISADLARTVNERLFAPHDLKIGDVAGLLHANIFTPLVTMKERQAGFTAAQIWTGNISRVGHCFSADPLVNLADRATAGAIRADHHYLLAASVPGARAGVLLRKLSR